MSGAICSTCVLTISLSARREERSSANADRDRSNVPTNIYTNTSVYTTQLKKEPTTIIRWIHNTMQHVCMSSVGGLLYACTERVTACLPRALLGVTACLHACVPRALWGVTACLHVFRELCGGSQHSCIPRALWGVTACLHVFHELCGGHRMPACVPELCGGSLHACVPCYSIGILILLQLCDQKRDLLH